MSGKSTYLRQVALIVLLAQMGSFVPAESARIGVVDRVFTRVGASDRLARGESTFMVEMRETAEILAHASRRSLVILDEIGRGTSTFDGLSIAWAVAEYLHDTPGLRAAHALRDPLPRADGSGAARRTHVGNAHFEAREWGDEVIFLRRLVPGGANRSYGIQVARLAGTAGRGDRARAGDPRRTSRAASSTRGAGRGWRAPSRRAPASADGQLGLFTGSAPPAGPGGGRRCSPRCAGSTPSATTPLEALELLARLVGAAARGRRREAAARMRSRRCSPRSACSASSARPAWRTWSTCATGRTPTTRAWSSRLDRVR